jgi:hypothetical protein
MFTIGGSPLSLRGAYAITFFFFINRLLFNVLAIMALDSYLSNKINYCNKCTGTELELS